MKCSDCKQDAVWIRATQFAGKHPFCKSHAEQQKDFGKRDSSYFLWKKVEEEHNEITR